MSQRVFIGSVSGFTADVDQSGRLSVNASVTANISGQSVFLGSGSFAPLSGLFVNISGQGVTASVTANVSGQSVFIAPLWLNVTDVSGTVMLASGQPFSGYNRVGNYIYDYSGMQWIAWGASTSGSTIARTQITNTPLSVNVVSGQVAALSGLGVREVGSAIINSSLSGAYIITGNSGGNLLFSGGPLLSATLRSNSGNSPMFVAGVGSNAPALNIGIPLYANESLTLKVSNFNAISAFASVSGQSLFYIGLA